jgi:hypothetical protein
VCRRETGTVSALVVISAAAAAAADARAVVATIALRPRRLKHKKGTKKGRKE